MKQNVGGRPRKDQNVKKIEEMFEGTHGRAAIAKEKRQEVRGPIQLTIIEQLSTLAAGFGESAAERTDFWRAAKPIIGDLNRKRFKKMFRKLQELEARGATAKAGTTG